MSHIRSNRCVAMVVAELEAAGLQYRVEHCGKHIHIRWGTGDDLIRRAVVASTSSDKRAALNARAYIRREIKSITAGGKQ